MQAPLPDWQLPPGVSRGLWQHLHDPDAARGYDASLAGTPLLEEDLRFADRHFQRPGRLIDLGCGTGRLLLRFAARGNWVLGVDLSEEMLRVAGEKAATVGVWVHRLRANVVQLECLADGTFDHAACLFSTLGMVTGREARRRVIGHVHRLLRVGGIFVLHVHNRWFDLWTPNGRRWLLGEMGRRLLGSGRGEDWSLPAHEGAAGWSLHLFTKGEVCQLLKDAGFQLIEVEAVSAAGRLPYPKWFGSLRAYGYLFAARKV